MGTIGYMSPEQASGKTARLPLGPVFARVDPLRARDGQARVPARRRARRRSPRSSGRKPSRSESSTRAFRRRSAGSSSGACEGPGGALRLDARSRERRAEHPRASLGLVRSVPGEVFGARGRAASGPAAARSRAAIVGAALLAALAAGTLLQKRFTPIVAAVLPADHLRQRHDPLGALRPGRADDRVQRLVGRRPAQAVSQAPVEPGLAAARAPELEPPRNLADGRDGDRARLPVEPPGRLRGNARARGADGRVAAGRGRGDPGSRLGPRRRRRSSSCATPAASRASSSRWARSSTRPRATSATRGCRRRATGSPSSTTRSRSTTRARSRSSTSRERRRR